MAFGLVKKILPAWQNALLALLAAGLLILAFPDFELWFLAWFALAPLMWAVERQKDSIAACFTIGWIFGTAFFFGTCWWLTYAPIHYAAFPWPLAYFLMLVVALAVGIFPAIFTTILAVLIRKFGSWAFLAAPFVWVFTEFLRYWLTGNNWNAIGYSQAFTGSRLNGLASVGGIALVSFSVLAALPLLQFVLLAIAWLGRRLIPKEAESADEPETLTTPIPKSVSVYTIVAFTAFLATTLFLAFFLFSAPLVKPRGTATSKIIALQPNVPMSGVDYTKLGQLRQHQFELAETEIKKLRTTNNEQPTLVILPESPMNFMYNDDREFQQYIGDFARRNNVSVLFNSAEPDATNGKYFNSAVMVGPDGREAAQYDKIFLLPFGEAVPAPLDRIVPGFVGNFSYGREYDILPVGDAKAGVMICFESHFGQLSREYVQNGADVLIEMTNDGYLGPTPVLRQHLANAVFRAVETNRPVLRVTNVGVTAYITENGQVLDAAPTYQEATRVWSVSKSDGSQTFYVKYGDWFAWLCTVVTIGLLIFGSVIYRRRIFTTDEHE
ncbi:MAG: apolipoprotein N-acyltransferase [Chloracidobacterium sp.]|nr:apolipoprotein N-acyltransferase [Chloracidobacterium sp.]